MPTSPHKPKPLEDQTALKTEGYRLPGYDWVNASQKECMEGLSENLSLLTLVSLLHFSMTAFDFYPASLWGFWGEVWSYDELSLVWTGKTYIDCAAKSMPPNY